MIDQTHEVNNSTRTAIAKLEDELIEYIKLAAERGEPFTQYGKSGVFKRKAELPESLNKLSRNKLEAIVSQLVDNGRIEQRNYALKKKNCGWLHVPEK